jgi:polyketide synthase 5
METGIRVGSTDITSIRGLADHLCGALAGLEGAPA